MARLTRTEQRALTRAGLLSAARERFLEVGYAAAGLDDIAERAGYSKGAVYSNFVDKPNLCREVLQAIHEEKLGELRVLAEAPGDLQARIDLLAEWIERTAGDVGWTMLELEFVTVARNDADLTGMIVDLRRAALGIVVDVLAALLGDGAAASPESLEATGEMLLAAGIGLGIQRAVDPTISVDPVVAAIRGGLTLLAVAG